MEEFVPEAPTEVSRVDAVRRNLGGVWVDDDGETATSTSPGLTLLHLPPDRGRGHGQETVDGAHAGDGDAVLSLAARWAAVGTAAVRPCGAGKAVAGLADWKAPT